MFYLMDYIMEKIISMKKMDDDKYLEWIKKYFTINCEGKSEEWVNHLLSIYKSHLDYGNEII